MTLKEIFFRSTIAVVAKGIVRVSSGFERRTTEKVSGHCVCGSRATGDFQKDAALSIVM